MDTLFDLPEEALQVDEMDKYRAQVATSANSMSAPNTVIHGAVAAIGDLLTTTWNSLTPESMEYSTQDLLQRVDKDALQVYNENPETIKTLSFVGGLIAPVGLALKGVNAARSGMKGISFFSEAGNVARLAEAKTAFETSGLVNANLNKITLGIYRAGAANALVDSVAAEAAITLTMNAHPYMEDYYKDFGTNFLIGTAIGGAIGTVGSVIISRGALKTIGQEVEKPLTTFLKENITPVQSYSHLGEQIQVRHVNIENMQEGIRRAADAEDPLVLSKYVTDSLKEIVVIEEARMISIFEDAAQGELKTVPKEIRDLYLDKMKDQRFFGTDKVEFATVKGTNNLSKQPGFLAKTWEFTKEVLGKDGEVATKQNKGVYSPIYDRFFGVEDASNYLTVADLGKTVKQMEKEIYPSMFNTEARSDFSLSLGVEHSAHLDEDAVKAFLFFKNKSLDEINKRVYDPQDINALRAIHARVGALEAAGEDVSKFKIQLTKNAPSYEARERVFLKSEGIDVDYPKRLADLDKEWDDIALFHPGKNSSFSSSNPTEFNQIASWVGGGYDYFRRGVAALNKDRSILDAFSFDVKLKAEEASRVLRTIKGSTESVELRNRFSKIADETGHVWLYRGTSNAPTGSRGVESYAITYGKASAFGDVRLYKVHVDDIIGGFRDIGFHGGQYHPEILVLPSTRTNEVVSRAGEIPKRLLRDAVEKASENIPKSSGITTLSSTQELMGHVELEAIKAVKSLSIQGHGVESISIRTAIPEETVAKIIAGEPLSNAGLSKYSSVENIEEAILQSKRSLQISTNLNKVPSAELRANLAARNLQADSKGLLEYYMTTSSSEVVQEIAKAFSFDEHKYLTEIMNNKIDDVSHSGLGNTFFRSVNSVLERFGEAGTIATNLGKKTIDLQNHAKDLFQKPIVEVANKIIKNEVELIELNTAINLNASAAGKRLYAHGKLWTPAEGVSVRDFIAASKLSKEEFAVWIKGPKDANGDFLKPMGESIKHNFQEYEIKSANVRVMMEKLQDYGRHMYELKNTYKRALGADALSDIGFWVPSFSPVGKHIAYLEDLVTHKTTMMYARSPAELKESVGKYTQALYASGERSEATTRVIWKEMQADFNKVASRHDPMYMEMADLSKQHGGSSAATLPSTNTTVIQEIINGYDYHVTRGVEDIVQVHLDKTMEQLRNLSENSRIGYDKNIQGVKKYIDKPVDAGQVVRNAILGKSNLSEHGAWAEWQQRGQVYTDMLLENLSDIFSPILKAGGNKRTAQDWERISQEMEKKGIVNPFAVLEQASPGFGADKFISEGSVRGTQLTSRAITLSNGLAATMLLRFAELGQPLVNAISLPILTSGAVNRKMAASFAGVALDPNAKFTTTRLMYDGVRLMMHPTEGVKWSKLGESRNLFKAIISEATELMHAQKQLEPGAMKYVEDVLESNLVRIMSKPSDYSETMVRKVSFFTGINMAKQAYPGISDIGAMTFARSFMDEAIGNYYAAQRPAAFHGTFGTAMGLFQTYMLTLGQQLYRGIESKNWVALGKQLLTQSTIFGASSLPGFHQVSEAIATHFSDNHVDLTTGTFRALPGTEANILIYGLPSSLGAGVTTRGDIQPRIPNFLGGIQNIAAVNFATQTFKALDRVAEAAFTADKNTGRAMLEAISLQSMSRPLARWAELINGSSITSKGNIVASGNDLYTPLGITARILATRPLEEIKLREADHANTLYRSIDSENRNKVTKALKIHIRDGDLDQEKLGTLQYEYMRSGSPSGWRSAVNTAMTQQTLGGYGYVKHRLGPDNPLQQMLEDL